MVWASHSVAAIRPAPIHIAHTAAFNAGLILMLSLSLGGHGPEVGYQTAPALLQGSCQWPYLRSTFCSPRNCCLYSVCDRRTGNANPLQASDLRKVRADFGQRVIRTTRRRSASRCEGSNQVAPSIA